MPYSSELLHELVDSVFNEGRVDLVDTLHSPDFCDKDMLNWPTCLRFRSGRHGDIGDVRRFVTFLGMPWVDIHFCLEQCVEEEGQAVAYGLYGSGTITIFPAEVPYQTLLQEEYPLCTPSHRGYPALSPLAEFLVTAPRADLYRYVPARSKTKHSTSAAEGIRAIQCYVEYMCYGIYEQDGSRFVSRAGVPVLG